MALEITDAKFQEDVLDSEKVSLVDFWATWCGPCRMIGPVIEELAGEYEGKANILKMNVDENSEIPAQYGIRSIPTLLFIKGGEIVDRHVGVASKAQLKSKLDALI